VLYIGHVIKRIVRLLILRWFIVHFIEERFKFSIILLLLLMLFIWLINLRGLLLLGLFDLNNLKLVD